MGQSKNIAGNSSVPAIQYELLWEAQRSKKVQRVIARALIRAKVGHTRDSQTRFFSDRELLAAIRIADFMASRAGRLITDDNFPWYGLEVKGEEPSGIPLVRVADEGECERWSGVLFGLMRLLLANQSVHQKDLRAGRRPLKLVCGDDVEHLFDRCEDALREIARWKSRGGSKTTLGTQRRVATFELLTICGMKPLKADRMIAELSGSCRDSPRREYNRHKAKAREWLLFWLMFLGTKLPLPVAVNLGDWYEGKAQLNERALENSLSNLAAQ